MAPILFSYNTTPEYVAPPSTDRTITIYARLGNTTSSLSNYGIYYNIDGGSDTLLATLSGMTTTCTTFNNFIVPNNSTLYIGVKNNSGLSGSAGISFNAVANSTCPSNTANYCGTSDTGDSSYYSYGTVTTSANIAITVHVTPTGNFLGCVI